MKNFKEVIYFTLFLLMFISYLKELISVVDLKAFLFVIQIIKSLEDWFDKDK